MTSSMPSTQPALPRYLVAVEELATEFRISLQRARDLMRSGAFPSFKHGRRWFTTRPEFEKYLRRIAKAG